MNKILKKYLPLYFQFLPGYWLAIWSAPYRCTAWQALRITIRKGQYHSLLVTTLKMGEV